MALNLGKVSRGPHLPTLVASSLSREIAEGRLAPGDQLPTEQVLAQTFGVSRTVIREAIATLRSDGRVWSQQGRGAFVSTVPQTTVLAIDHAEPDDPEAFRSLFELRSLLEVEAAALAAERRSVADLAAMQAAHKAMAVALYGSTDWLDADLDLHARIAAATGNDYITHVLGFVAERVRDSILAAGSKRRSDEVAQVTLGEHGRILDAITEGDRDKARVAMRLHLEGASRRVGISKADAQHRVDIPA